MRKLHLELGAAAIAVLASIAGLMSAWSYPKASGLMPRAVLVITLCLALVWLVQTLSQSRKSEGEVVTFAPLTIWRFCVVVGGTAVVIIGASTIGFFTCALIMLPIMAVAIGYRSPARLAIGTLAFVALLYSVFNLLLQIPLPPEAILTHLG